MRKFKIGIALGGGGARGLAHIGVLRVLEKKKIIPDIVAGTSIGALIGAMYCCGMSLDEIEKKVASFLDTEIYKNLKFESMSSSDDPEKFLKNIINTIKRKAMVYLANVKMAFLEKSAVESMIEYFLPDIDFRDLKIPFSCVAADISQGREIVFNKGPIWEAVSSSISIPGVMPPVKFEGHILVDGGAVQLVPIKVIKDMGSDFSIGIDVSSNMPVISEDELKNALDIEHRTGDVTLSILRKLQLKEADFVIEPPVKNINLFEIKRFKECILAGENEMTAKVSKLKEQIRDKRQRTFFKRIFQI